MYTYRYVQIRVNIQIQIEISHLIEVGGQVGKEKERYLIDSVSLENPNTDGVTPIAVLLHRLVLTMAFIGGL